MPRKSNSSAQKRATSASSNEVLSESQDTTPRRSSRSGGKNDGMSPAIMEGGRSRRSSTAAQTAASVADAHRTKSKFPSTQDAQSPVSGRRTRGLSGGGDALESPATRVKSARRSSSRINYEESEGEDEVSTKQKDTEEDDYDIDEDVENDSDSVESGKGRARGRTKSSPKSRSRPRGRSRGQSTPSKKRGGGRGRKPGSRKQQGYEDRAAAVEEGKNQLEVDNVQNETGDAAIDVKEQSETRGRRRRQNVRTIQQAAEEQGESPSRPMRFSRRLSALSSTNVQEPRQQRPVRSTRGRLPKEVDEDEEEDEEIESEDPDYAASSKNTKRRREEYLSEEDKNGENDKKKIKLDELDGKQSEVVLQKDAAIDKMADDEYKRNLSASDKGGKNAEGSQQMQKEEKLDPASLDKEEPMEVECSIDSQENKTGDVTSEVTKNIDISKQISEADNHDATEGSKSDTLKQGSSENGNSSAEQDFSHDKSEKKEVSTSETKNSGIDRNVDKGENVDLDLSNKKCENANEENKDLPSGDISKRQVIVDSKSLKNIAGQKESNMGVGEDAQKTKIKFTSSVEKSEFQIGSTGVEANVEVVGSSTTTSSSPAVSKSGETVIKSTEHSKPSSDVKQPEIVQMQNETKNSNKSEVTAASSRDSDTPSSNQTSKVATETKSNEEKSTEGENSDTNKKSDPNKSVIVNGTDCIVKQGEKSEEVPCRMSEIGSKETDFKTNGAHVESSSNSQSEDSKHYKRKYIHNPSISEDSRTSLKGRTYGFASYRLSKDDTLNKDSLLREIKCLNADVICFQEVQKHFLRETIANSLDSLGYKYVDKYFAEDDSCGLATLYRSSSFKLVDHIGILVDHVIKKELETSSLSAEDKEAIGRFIPKCGHCLATRLSTVSGDKVLNIVNVHLPPLETSSHALQVSCLAREVVSSGTAHVMCGTFNAVENQAPYQLLRDGYLSNEMIEDLQKRKDVVLPGKENAALVNLLWKLFQHPASSLQSCYTSVLGHELCMPSESEGKTSSATTSPYLMWLSSDSLTPVGVLDAPSSEFSQLHPCSTALKVDIAFK